MKLEYLAKVWKNKAIANDCSESKLNFWK